MSQFKLRTLMSFVALFAAAMTFEIRPLFLNHEFVKSLRNREVFITTKPWFRAFPAGQEIFCSHVHARVRLRPGVPGQVSVLGRELTFQEAERELLTFKKDIKNRLGLDRFSLAVDWPTGEEDRRFLSELAVKTEAYLEECSNCDP